MSVLLTADPNISAIGDCAAFPSRHSLKNPVRLEAVQNAADHARCVADRLVGKGGPYTALPWFWSEQGALRLQIAGLTTGFQQVVLRGNYEGGEYSAFCYAGDKLLGIELINKPADHAFARRLLAAGRSVTPTRGRRRKLRPARCGDGAAELGCRRRSAQQRQRDDQGDELRGDEARRVDRPYTGESVGQRTGDRHRRVGERGRGGEPIGAADIGGDRERRHRLLMRAAAPDHHQQAEGRDDLGDPLPERRCGCVATAAAPAGRT